MGFGKDNTARIARDQRQETFNQFVERAYGARFLTLSSRIERCIEEMGELTRAGDFPRERALEVFAQGYDQAKGELPQEIGGLSISILSLGQVAGYSVDQCEQDELRRQLDRSVEDCQAKLRQKVAAGICTDEAA